MPSTDFLVRRATCILLLVMTSDLLRAILTQTGVIARLLGLIPLIFTIFILKRNDVDMMIEMESLFDQLGLYFLRDLMPLLAKAFSLSKAQQKKELAKFIHDRREIETLVQQYEYYQKGGVAKKELERLSVKAHHRI